MAGSKNDKKIKDIEYNVMNSGFDKKEGGNYGGGNSGCVAVVVGIIIIAAICLLAFGLMNHSGGASKAYCAEKGCSRPVKSGSNYCWLHSGGSLTKPRKNNQSDTQDKDKSTDNSRDSWSGGSNENKNEETNGGSSSVSGNSSSDSSSDSADKSNSGKVSY